MDATEQEECCIGARLVVAVNAEGSICCILQDKSGGIKVAAMVDMLRIAQQTANALFLRLNEADPAAGSLVTPALED